MNDIPHLAMPLSLTGATGKRYNSHQQGTVEEVSDCVAVICSFERGSREEAPEFGIADPAFVQRPVDIADIQATCEEYEPRAVIRIAEAPLDPHDPLAAPVTIGVSLLQAEDF